MTFLVVGLPRSRTAWLAKFLTYGGVTCGHEELRHCRSLEDVDTWFSQPGVGSAETAAAPWWRLFPDCKVVVVRRPVSEVVGSLMAIPGVTFDREALTRLMEYHDRKLDQIEARLDCLSVTFDDLNTEATCKAVFEHCLPYTFDADHWRFWKDRNVQCDMVALMKYAAAYAPQMDKLGKVAAHRIKTRIALRKPVTDGMELQTEDFDTWLKDAERLFDEHLCQVGEAPGDWGRKNIPLMRAMFDAGAMQITTARANGRMFGYLMTIVSPSLTSPNKLSAAHTTFFASPDAPGLGLKLQRAALGFLKARGVSDVVMQAGVRGSGEKIGAIYKRLGAANDGQMFRLQLAEN